MENNDYMRMFAKAVSESIPELTPQTIATYWSDDDIRKSLIITTLVIRYEKSHDDDFRALVVDYINRLTSDFDDEKVERDILDYLETLY